LLGPGDLLFGKAETVVTISSLVLLSDRSTCY